MNENSYEVLENGAGKFKTEITGCPVASARVVEVQIDGIVARSSDPGGGRGGRGQAGQQTPPRNAPPRLPPGDLLTLAGFSIDIGDGAGSSGEVDSSWESCAGGSLNIEWSDSSTGADQSQTTTPGHKYVDTLTLHGPLTSGRKALCSWITEVVQGKNRKQTITVTEITRDRGAAKTYRYHDCFPTRYVFPKFSAAATGNLYEEVAIKPIRLELQ